MEDKQRAFMMLFMVLFTLGLMVAVMALFSRSPVLCSAGAILMGIVYVYMHVESSIIHGAQEFENRFWMGVAFLFSIALFFAEDSPLAIGRYSTNAGLSCVVFCTFLAHYYDRKLHREQISRNPNLKRSLSSTFPGKYRATAKEKLELIAHSLQVLDHSVVPSTITNVLTKTKNVRHEAKIVRIITNTTAEELNYIINRTQLGLLFYKVKNHSDPAMKFRTQLVDYMAVERVSDLKVESKAIVVDALQQLRLTAHDRSEWYVRNIFVKTKGDDLSQLKTLMDSKGDVHSLHKLLYDDIKSDEIRAEILEHIEKEARVQAAHMRLKTRNAKKRSGYAWRKVLSDVDDTLFSSGGRYPAGIDTCYPRHQLYPGVLAFYRELDLGASPGSPEAWEKNRVGNLVFLSARPHVYKDLSEKKTYDKFKALQEKGLHTTPTLLAGSTDSGRAFMLNKDLEPMAAKKFENFQEFHALYPEFKHVFIGDNGQGDVRGAELMRERYGEAVESSYMHKVQPLEKTHGWDEGAEERWRSMGIAFFDNYVEAACTAFDRGQIQLVGLQRVAESAVKEFMEIDATSWEERAEQRVRLNEAVRNANALLSSADLGQVPQIPQDPIYAKGDRIQSLFGKGTVVSWRRVDTELTPPAQSFVYMYEIELDWSLLAAGDSKGKGAAAWMVQTQLNSVDVPLNSTPAAGDSMHRGFWGFFAQRKVDESDEPIAVGDVVETPYGDGTVREIRVDPSVARAGSPSVRADTPLESKKEMPPAAEEVFEEKDEEDEGGDAREDEKEAVQRSPSTESASSPCPSSRSKTTSPEPPLLVNDDVEAAVQSPPPRPTVFVVELRTWRLAQNTAVVCYLQLGQVKRVSAAPPPPKTPSLAGMQSPSLMSNAISFISRGLGLYRGVTVEVFHAGDAVFTPYGKGTVLKHRALAMGAGEGASGSPAGTRTDAGVDTEAVNTVGDVETYVVELNGWELSTGKHAMAYLHPTQLASTADRLKRLLESQNHDFGHSKTVAGFDLNAVSEESSADTGGAAAGSTGWMSYLRGGMSFQSSQHPSHMDLAALGAAETTGPGEHQCRYFPGSMVVAKPFGEGTVVSFREHDGLYKVRLQFGGTFFGPVSSLAIPVRADAGAAVLTTFGLGTLENVRDDGVHVVRQSQLTGSAVMYLQPSHVIGTVKAVIGDMVVVKRLNVRGRVVGFRPRDGMYMVALEWELARGCQVHAYATGESISRVAQTRKGRVQTVLSYITGGYYS